MKLLRASLRFALILALAVVSPGGSAWAAVGRVVTPVAPRAAVPSVPAGSMNLRIGASLTPLAVPASNVGLTSPLSAPTLQAPVVHVPLSARVAAAGAPVAAPAVSPIAASPIAAAKLAPAASAAAAAAAPLQAALTAAGEQAAAFAAPDKGEAAAKSEAGRSFDLSIVRSAAADAPISGVNSMRAGLSVGLTKKGDKGMPDRYDEQGNPDSNQGGGNIDELGNERRRGGEGGPDDATDPDHGGRGGGAPLFAVVGVAGGLAAMGGFSVASLMIFPFIAISLILHEIGHAKVAALYGDYTATLQNRASLNPKHWLTHVDPLMTIAMPIVTFFLSGFMFGGAKPVPIEARNFRNPVKDMAVVTFAGPAVNFALAVAGSLAVTGALAAGLGAAVAGALVTFTFLNVALGIFNLIPVHPLDGSHILRAFLPQNVSDRLDRFYDSMGSFGFLPVILIAVLGGGMITGLALGITNVLVSVPLGLSGLQMAGSWAFSTAALGLALGQTKISAANDAPLPPADGSAAVDLVVVFGAGAVQGVRSDNHLSWVDLNQPNGVDMYAQAQSAMTSQIESAGALGAGALATMGATPIATYRRINAATVRLDAVRAGEFERAMRERGHAVFPNARREIVRPVNPEPERMDPSARGAVTMQENLQITKADKVHAVAAARWGAPDMGGVRGFLRRLTGSTPVQPKTAVIDSGVDLRHPLLKRVKESKNATTGENIDDIGHGTWVHSMGLNYAPWSKASTHYKTFVNGGATLDDILKALTMAGNDGNLVMSNSWGSDDGDPMSPDSQLVRKLAEEGHIMIFAAGNAGSRPNTIGSPAIVYHKDATTGTIRVVSVAATGRDKKVAYFSSRGPGSYKTKTQPGYPKRPDLSAIGYNTEGAWPAALRDADRTDPVAGPLKAISGTSMSTPSVYGAVLLLLMMFGVTTKGPQADAVVNAVMSTLENTGQGHDNEGDGFMNVEAAYAKLVPSRDIIERWQAMAKARDAAIGITATLSLRGGSKASRDDISSKLALFEADLASMAARHPLLASDPKRADRMRRELDTAEYKALLREIRELHKTRGAYLKIGSEARHHNGDIGDEILAHVETEIEPRLAAAEARVSEIRRANPRVAYDSASALGRWWLRVTGRGPAA